MTAAELIARADFPHELLLDVAGVRLRVATNDHDMWTALRLYYDPWVVRRVDAPAATVRLAQGTAEIGDGWRDVIRPDGKRVKEAVREEGGLRLVLKRATGVVMGIAPGVAWAVGDLRANVNQAVNLVNHCYAAALLPRDYLLWHASAVSWNGRAVALAGPPGAGKSTAALALVEAGFRFVTNDRLLVRSAGMRVEALGYPKRPRVNPGTLLHHPRLSRFIPPGERAALRAMDADALWEFERKSDVDLDGIYGRGTMELRAELQALVYLGWRRRGGGLHARRLDVSEALARVQLVHKDLGVFDVRHPVGTVTAPDRHRYATLFGRMSVIEVTGGAAPAALSGVVAPLVGASWLPAPASADT